jgi:hypothetical protein
MGSRSAIRHAGTVLYGGTARPGLFGVPFGTRFLPAGVPTRINGLEASDRALVNKKCRMSKAWVWKKTGHSDRAAYPAISENRSADASISIFF